MNRREQMQQALNAELERWSSMTVDELVEQLREEQNYQVSSGSQEYQFEVQLLENTPRYIHVGIAVDDGRLPFLGVSMSTSFLREKTNPEPGFGPIAPTR